MFNRDNFDFVAFIAWFESLIDYILKLITGIKNSTATTAAPETTTVAADETTTVA